MSNSPHILFFVADDYGWNDVGFHGSGEPTDYIPTPDIDQLASEGIKLNNYYVQPMCTPSRASFMTGRYPVRYGLQHYVLCQEQQAGLNLSEVTIAQKMQQSGYATHAIGKWHLGFYKWDYTPTYRGFDSFLGYYAGVEDHFAHYESEINAAGYDFRNNTEVHVTAQGTYGSLLFVDQAIDIVRQYGKDTSPDKKPLFIYLAMQVCHNPLQAPQQYIDRCASVSSDRSRQLYCAMTLVLNDGLANVTRAFQDAGIWNDTLLVFTTDNGGPINAGASNWPLRGSKSTLWEGGVRGVAFVRGSGVPASLTNTTSDALMHATDWLPTLVGLVGGNTKDTLPLDGFNQWKAIVGGAPAPRVEILLNIDSLDNNSALRTGDMKLVVGPQAYNGWYPLPPAAPVEAPQNVLSLFNVTADPLERKDLSEQYPDIVKAMLQRIEYYRDNSVPPWFPENDLASNPARFGNAWTPWM